MSYPLDTGASTPNMPGSPPALSNSKSSKSSSFHSSYPSSSSDNSILADAAHFEDIGLDDESRCEADVVDFTQKASMNPYDATYASDLRNTANQRKRVPMAPMNGNNRVQRELTAGKTRPAYPSLRGQVRSATSDTMGLKPQMRSFTADTADTAGLKPVHNGSVMARRGLASVSTPTLIMTKRHRSTSPGLPQSPRYNSFAATTKLRRGSWQANRERKTTLELEKECDEEDGDDVPDECFLENVPISPRPRGEPTPIPSPTLSISPERPPKEKVRSLGNGTSPKPAEQGELRSSKPGAHRGASMGQFPIHRDPQKVRAKSWTDALSEEAKALTQALEAHAESEQRRLSDPTQSLTSTLRPTASKPRVKSALAALPPLRRPELMIDPLPASKEKEAVLSRTRPSWLPPKDPAEERRHLKEYQRMMSLSLEAERKREAEQEARKACRDDTAASLLRIWEEHVLPNWDAATRQRRTRELWWRGIAPRSRGAVWMKAIGNQLGLSEASYTAALRRAKALEGTVRRGVQLSADEERKSAWLGEIERDVENTWPELKIFQKGGPLYGALVDLCSAYAMYRSDVGYVKGTSTIAALLLLNLPTPAHSFLALSNLLNRPLPLSFHTSDHSGTNRVYALVLSSLARHSPRLHAHLTSPELGLEPGMYLGVLFTGLFTGGLSLDNVTRLWDVAVFEGDKVLVRGGVAYLAAVEGKLFGATTPDEVVAIVREGFCEMSEEEWMERVRDVRGV